MTNILTVDDIRRDRTPGMIADIRRTAMRGGLELRLVFTDELSLRRAAGRDA